MDLDLIRHIEEMAARAWPPAVDGVLAGWHLRWASGVTRRANSVWADRYDGSLPVEDMIDRVEAFYAGHRLPARYQLCAASLPPHLDAILEERGYTIHAPTDVLIAPLETICGRMGSLRVAVVSIQEDFTDDWLQAYIEAEARHRREAEGRREILERIQPRTAFALLHLEGQPAAVGLGVLEGQWAGLFCMATRSPFRGRGGAAALLHALARWGQEEGAVSMYLQVQADNDAGLALYRRAGFEPLYRYHYREAP